MKHYYELTKSGLVFGNLITVIAGFLLGERMLADAGAGGAVGGVGAIVVDPRLFIATLFGIALVMASGCVFNNCIDRDIDITMERTKHRALVAGNVSFRAALVFATVLGVAGFLVLAFFTNAFAVGAAAVGFIFYVFAYSLWGKRRSEYGTFIGAIAGATPPVVGYAVASGRIDLGALILFLIMLAWQMPHFFAIAIWRQDDYAVAKIPVLPIRRGIARTKISMAIYILEFIVAASLLYIFNYTGMAYLVIVLMLGVVWFGLGLKGLSIAEGDSAPVKEKNRRWAQQMFFISLIVMVVLFATIAIGAVI